MSTTPACRRRRIFSAICTHALRPERGPGESDSERERASGSERDSERGRERRESARVAESEREGERGREGGHYVYIHTYIYTYIHIYMRRTWRRVTIHHGPRPPGSHRAPLSTQGAPEREGEGRDLADRERGEETLSCIAMHCGVSRFAVCMCLRIGLYIGGP